MDSCEVSSRLWLKIAAAGDLIHELQRKKATKGIDTHQIAEQLTAARKLGREAIQAFEEHCREHGCSGNRFGGDETQKIILPT
jgi:hypothetical protein